VVNLNPLRRKRARSRIMQHDPIDEKSDVAELQPDPVPAGAERRPRGFAAMDPNLVRDIARKGGKAAHAAGTAHEFTSDEARAAGRKGGQASHAKRRERVEKPL
jgi:general stress protein YciG